MASWILARGFQRNVSQGLAGKKWNEDKVRPIVRALIQPESKKKKKTQSGCATIGSSFQRQGFEIVDADGIKVSEQPSAETRSA